MVCEDKAIYIPSGGAPGDCAEPVDKRQVANQDLLRRAGRMRISDVCLELDTIHMSQMFAMLGFIPTRCEHMYSSSNFEVTGLSPLFDLLDVGECIPEYMIEMHADDQGNLDSIKPCRQK